MYDCGLDSLLNVVEQEGIFLSYYNLTRGSKPISGLYFYDPKLDAPCIVLERTLKNDLPAYRSLLAEGLGYHATLPKPKFFYPYVLHSRRTHLNGIQAQALRWATDFLIPDNELTDAYQRRIRSQRALASTLR